MANLSYTAASAAVGGMVGTDATTGATLYLALSNTLPSLAAGVISNVTEPTAGSYARVAMVNATDWTITDGVAENSAVFEFPEATANWDVTVSYYVVYTAASGGTALWWGDLVGAPVTIVLGNTPTYAAGELTISAS